MILSYQKFQFLQGATLNNQKLIENCIKDAEFMDFRKLAGETVYNGIISEQNSDAGYSEELLALLEKGVYECISNFAYAAYVMRGDLVSTFSGVVQKSNQYSEHMDLGTRKNTYVYYRDIASNYYELVRKDIEAYFGVGKCDCSGGERHDSLSEIIGIRRTGGCGKKVEIINM